MGSKCFQTHVISRNCPSLSPALPCQASTLRVNYSGPCPLGPGLLGACHSNHHQKHSQHGAEERGSPGPDPGPRSQHTGSWSGLQPGQPAHILCDIRTALPHPTPRQMKVTSPAASSRCCSWTETRCDSPWWCPPWGSRSEGRSQT